ncbi:hypothetical protein [Commensalibacter oyaizuii]|uniref:Uncharacterized protein n=1 Tax=Commensalibacter oyaizuii TaxID=3043873 RepID=A0ABT6Q2D6_9PROT|nr:hypothetical protein [Commensalibacter sp. TBRC 16381]MDI2091288.1 hypothetical protein [Commensalibacter sp. TBRC 16381]
MFGGIKTGLSFISVAGQAVRYGQAIAADMNGSGSAVGKTLNAKQGGMR